MENVLFHKDWQMNKLKCGQISILFKKGFGKYLLYY